MAEQKNKKSSSKSKKTKALVSTKVKPEIFPAQEKKSSFYIVGLGTSAGGLEALEVFFRNCPSDTGLAFIIVQHLSPDYKSLMPELLSRHTKMNVTEAKDKGEVKPDHVYLIPGSKNLTISNGKIHLTKRPPSAMLNFSIDIFFNSLALEQKERAIGIILSGTGSDGTKGGKSIKEVGGTMFIQNPDDARFDGMPRSAINGGLADFILSAAEIPGEIIQFVSHPQFAKTITGVDLGKDLEKIDRILKILKNHTSYDFFSYKRPTLLRRTAKRMNITKCESVENYIDFLYDNPDEKHILVDEFLIGVTKFFRDQAAYQIMKNQVIPDIVEEKYSKKQPIKIWVVACSTGEEAYSLAILFDEYITLRKYDIKYKIFATDIDGKSIDIATKGCYSENIATDVSPDRLATYFTKKDHEFQIKPAIRKNIIFSKHDVLQHPPFNKMDLISCRNMLIYIDNVIQAKVLASLHYALNKNGYLFMGSSESLGVLNKNFNEVSTKWKIYRNVLPTKMIHIESNAWRVDNKMPGIARRSRQVINIEDKAIKAVNQDLMLEMEAACVCVDENFDVLYTSGKFKKYISIPDEGFTNNLLKLLPEELIIPITMAVRKLAKDESETIFKNVQTLENKTIKKLRLIMKVLPLDGNTYRSFLITIIEKSERALTKKEEEKYEVPAAGLNHEEITELRDALNETRENLQATIEELETSNEEMQATNEELLASNEELQSTNEELQSLNEELHTVNAELQEKNVQLIEANSDIENLMVNTNIATIFLDREFNIRKFTPAIKEHFQLLDTDVGRPIDHFSGTMGGDHLVEYAEDVLKKLTPFRLEFQNNQGIWFLLQVFPYQNQDNVIQGVVVNFININELKKTVNENAVLDNYISHLTLASPATIYVYNLQTRENVFATRAISTMAGYSEEEVKRLGDGLLLKIIHPDDFPKVVAHHEKMLKAEDGIIEQLEYRIIHRLTREYIYLLSSDKVYERDETGNVLTILGVAQNITYIKLIEEKVIETEKRTNLALQSTGAGIWEWSDIRRDDAWWSPEFYKLLGYSAKTLNASYGALLTFIHPDDVVIFQNKMDEHLNHKTPFEIELKIKTKRKGYRWFKINLQAQWDKEGKPTKVVGILFDINEKRQLLSNVEEKTARLDAIHNNALTGITLSDTKGVIVSASKGVERILGYRPKDLIGKSFIEITFQEEKDLSKIEFLKLKKGEIPYMRIDKRYICKDKSVKWIDANITKTIISGEEYYLCVMVDVEKRKKAENEMHVLNQELERFAYLASHDLKEPLRTITSVTERLKEKHGPSLDKSANQYIEFIEQASNRMQKVTSGLLIHSELGRKIQKYHSINTSKLVKEAIADLATSIDENNAKFTIKRLPKIMGDPMQLSLLFQNLISNSLKYRKKRTNPLIEIGYENKGDHWEFFVKDNGIGIAKEHQKKIFEVFTRLHNKKEYAGLGIGLASCKRIVENHLGEIWVESRIRKGTTVYFTIPKKQAKQK